MRTGRESKEARFPGSELALGRLGKWVASTTHESIPENALGAARFQVLNMIAAVHASAGLPDTRAVALAIASCSSSGRSTAIVPRREFSAPNAAMINAAYSMAQDFDDIVWMGHTAHSAVFASLAVAEHEGSTTRDLITAVVVANEIAGRLGASSFLGPLNGQMWTFIHLVGAAAATAKLLRLDAIQAAHALAIALSQPTFALQPAFMASSSKLLAASIPTAIGMQAAFLAAQGITGHLGILEDSRGFWHRFSFLPMPHMLGGLGEFWTMETLTVKTFPGCHYFQTACTALDRLIRRNGKLSKTAIKSIDIETTKLGYEVTCFARNYSADKAEGIDHINMNFDLATTAAVLLYAGQLTSRETRPEWLAEHAPHIHDWRNLITVKHAPELTVELFRAARRIPAGRRGLAELTPQHLLRLRKRYAREYNASLISVGEAWEWLTVLLNEARKYGRAPSEESTRSPDRQSGLPLPFPNRVSIRFKNGHVDRERVDLPVGSVASPECHAALEQKFFRELTGNGVSQSAAEKAFKIGLDLENHELREFLVDVSARPLF